MAKSRQRGLGTAGEFELDLGRQVADLQASDREMR
jgi:hypothetical protein